MRRDIFSSVNVPSCISDTRDLPIGFGDGGGGLFHDDIGYLIVSDERSQLNQRDMFQNCFGQSSQLPSGHRLHNGPPRGFGESLKCCRVLSVRQQTQVAGQIRLLLPNQVGWSNASIRASGRVFFVSRMILNALHRLPALFEHA